MCSNFKSFDLDTLFQGSNTAFMGMFKTDVRVCKKCKGRHANRYLNQKQGREISAKKRH